MDSTKYLTFFNKYNDDLDRRIIRQALVYLDNEAILIESNGDVIHYLNSGPKKVNILSQKEIVKFAYAFSIEDWQEDYHILALTQFEIYGIGRNTYRQVQFESSQYQANWVKLPIELKIGETFLSIANVYGHSMVLTSQNKVILWGKNDQGQIGNGTKSEVERPFKLIFQQDSFAQKLIFENRTRQIVVEDGIVVEIACSSSNSFALLDNGKVYGWGLNTIGQLGSQLENNFLKPMVIFGNIKQIVAFNSHTMVLRRDGVLFGMGNNANGQVGAKVALGIYAKPFRFDMKFERIATWENLSMAQTKEFYIWGEYGKVVFPCITIRKEIKRTKYIDRGVQVNMDEIESKTGKNKIKRKKGFHRSSSPPPSYSDIDKPSGSGQNNVTVSDSSSESSDEESEDNDEQKIDPSDSDQSSTDGDKKRQDKKKFKGKKNKEKEKAELLDAILNSKVELMAVHLDLFNLTEVKCDSLEEIVARRYNRSYFTLKNYPDNSAEFTDVYHDKELIDLSNFIAVKYEYYYEVEEPKPVPSNTDKKDEDNKLNALERRVREVEQKKYSNTTINKYQFGDRSKFSVFDKTNLSEIKDFNVSDIVQTNRQDVQ